MGKSQTVYPVEGLFIQGVPHVEHDCTDKLCLESGAFTDKPPPKAGKQNEEPAEAGSSDSEEK